MKLTRYSRLATAVVAGALLLTACGSDDNTGDDAAAAGSSSSPSSDSCLAGTLNAEGSSAQQNAIDEVIANYTAECADTTINYNPTGSGAGVEQFNAGQVDFAGSDSALKEDEGEVAAAKERCGGNDAWNLPMVVGPIAVAYNLDGVDGLVLTPEVAAKIFKGAITKWNDPAIAALNDGRDAARRHHQGVLPQRRVRHHGELPEVPRGRRRRRLDRRAVQGVAGRR